MSSPTDRCYSESHEWFLHDGDMVTVGLTHHATEELTDITYVEMQPVGTEIATGGSLGEVESVKTTAEVFTAVGGTVAEVNDALSADPSILNSDPYDAGWLVKLTVSDATNLENLMDGAAYDLQLGIA